MDIISYGAASKAASAEKKTKNDTLGVGVQGEHDNVKERIDAIEKSYSNVSKLADNLIIKDAVNIMKANAKLNTIAKSKKYKMQNMIFDDLLDLSGIDTALSSGYTHIPTEGSIKEGKITTSFEASEVTPSKAILTMEARYDSGGIDLSDYTGLLKKHNVDYYNKYYAPSESNAINFYNTYKNIYVYMMFIYSKDGTSSMEMYSSQTPMEFKLENGMVYRNGTSKINRIHSAGGATNLDGGLKSLGYGVDYVLLSNQAVEEKISDDEIKSYIKTYISRNDGQTWEPIIPNELFHFDNNVSPLDNKLRIKAELTSGTKLLNYGLTWS